MRPETNHRTIPNEVRFPPKADPPLAEECVIPYFRDTASRYNTSASVREVRDLPHIPASVCEQLNVRGSRWSFPRFMEIQRGECTGSPHGSSSFHSETVRDSQLQRSLRSRKLRDK